jgi:hypothetical protein
MVFLMGTDSWLSGVGMGKVYGRKASIGSGVISKQRLPSYHSKKASSQYMKYKLHQSVMPSLSFFPCCARVIFSTIPNTMLIWLVT